MSELRALLNPPTAVVEDMGLEVLFSPVPGRLPGFASSVLERADRSRTLDRVQWREQRFAPAEDRQPSQPA